MQIEQQQDCGDTQTAPRSGASAVAAPLLDIEGRNVPGDNPPVRPRWTKKQWTTRRTVIDLLRYWQANGYQCVWVTLTSSPQSSRQRLRRDFQVLRKRIGRELGFSGFEYVCVDTLEGHGVLHMIWAWRDPNPRKRASFYIAFKWLQDGWNDIHGAFHVNIKRIGTADRDARRLSRYIVAQYCGAQDGLVRVSQSRMAIPFTRMRQALLRAMRSFPERYEHAGLFATGLDTPTLSRLMGQFFWLEFRHAWDDLVRSRSCKAYGVHLAWWDGKLRRV